MNTTVALLVLLAAVLHATWNAVVKAGEDKLVALALVIFTKGLLALVAIPFLPLPAPASWPFLLTSAVVHYLYYGVLVVAYRHGDLSLVYPIARGSAPVLAALGAWALAGEALGLLEWGGVLIVSAGIMSLAKPTQGDGKAIGLALLTGLTIAVFSLADGLGVRRSGEALAYIAWLFAFCGLPMLAFASWRRRGRALALIGSHWKTSVLGGLVGAAAYGIVIWAMSVAPIALVVSLRETSVLIAAAIGALILKEGFGPRRVASAVVIVAGAALIKLGS